MTPANSIQNLNAKLSPRPERRPGSQGVTGGDIHRSAVRDSDRPARVSGNQGHYRGGYCINV